MKKLTFITLIYFFLSSSVFAVTVTEAFTSCHAALPAINQGVLPANIYVCGYSAPRGSFVYAYHDGDFGLWTQRFPFTSFCTSSETLNQTLGLCQPICPSNQTLNPSTNICEDTVPTCTSPQIINLITNTCQTPPSCTLPQIFNNLVWACLTPPRCTPGVVTPGCPAECPPPVAISCTSGLQLLQGNEYCLGTPPLPGNYCLADDYEPPSDQTCPNGAVILPPATCPDPVCVLPQVLINHICALPTDPVCVPPQLLINHVCIVPAATCVAGTPSCTVVDPKNPGTPSNPTPGTPCTPGSVNCSDATPPPVTCKPGTPGCTIADPNNPNVPGVPCLAGTKNCTGTSPTPCDPLTTNCGGDGAKETTLQKLMDGTSKNKSSDDLSTLDPNLPLQKEQLAKSELDSLVLSIKNDSSVFFNPITSTFTNLPVIDYGTIRGVHVQVDFNRFIEIFNTIGSVLLFLAAVYSIAIVLG